MRSLQNIFPYRLQSYFNMQIILCVMNIIITSSVTVAKTTLWQSNEPSLSISFSNSHILIFMYIYFYFFFLNIKGFIAEFIWSKN